MELNLKIHFFSNVQYLIYRAGERVRSMRLVFTYTLHQAYFACIIKKKTGINKNSRRIKILSIKSITVNLHGLLCFINV